MGNDIKTIGGKVGKIIQQFDTPQDHTDQGVPLNINQNVQDCKELNNLLLKHILNLGSKLQLEERSIVKNGPKWEKSIVRGVLSVELLHKSQEQLEEPDRQKQQKKEQIKQQRPSEEATHKEQSYAQRQNNMEKIQCRQQTEHEQQKKKLTPKSRNKKRSFNIILTLGQVYELKRLLVSYTMEETELESKRKSFSGQLCVICLDNKPEEVLPCAHQYCRKCVNMYIVNKDKKCPMCRKSYQQSLSQNIYQIVEWDEDFVVEMRSIFYKILQRNNAKQVHKVRRIIEANEKYEKQLTPKGNKEEQI